MIHVTAHAVRRYRERVSPVDPHAADQALRSRAVQQAIDFGAPYVRLATGQRIVLNGATVVTVLPSHCQQWRLGTPKDKA